METFLIATQVIFAIFLSLVILLQQKGTGLGAVFGGDGGGFHSSKRGADKVLHVATIVLSVLFTLNSIAFLFIG